MKERRLPLNILVKGSFLLQQKEGTISLYTIKLNLEALRIISLPIYPGMRDEDVERVIDAVSDIIAKNKR